MKNYLKTHTGIFVSAIALIFFCLSTFPNLNLRAFWLDETATALAVQHPLKNILQVAINDSHPIFYLVSLKIWSSLFGNSEASFRGLSAVFGVLLCFLIYKTTIQIFKDKTAGLLAFVLSCTNYFLVWFSTQNRPYTIIAFVGLLSFYLYHKLLDNFKTTTAISYVLVSAIACGMHPWLILAIFSQLVSAILIYRDNTKIKRLLLAYLLIFLIAIPFFYVYLVQGKMGVSDWIDKPSIFVLWESIKYLCYGSGVAYLLIFILFLFFYCRNKNSEEGKTILSILLYLFFPLIVALLVSFVKPAYFAGRYEMVVLPAFILLFSWMFSKIRNVSVVIQLIILLAVLAFVSVKNDRDQVLAFKSSDRTIASDLLNKIDNNDIILTTDVTYASYKYYLTTLNTANKPITIVAYPQEIVEHPGWRSLKKLSQNQKEYELEATSLVKKLKMGLELNAKIYCLYSNSVPTNNFLLNELNRNFKLINSYEPELPHQPTWLTKVFVYKNLAGGE